MASSLRKESVVSAKRLQNRRSRAANRFVGPRRRYFGLTLNCAAIVVLATLILFSSLIIAPTSTHAYGPEDLLSTREEILASRRRRSRQLEDMLEDAMQRLRDHEKQIRILSDSDKAALVKKIDIYQRKLNTMVGELDEREVDRILEREKLRNERLHERRRRDEL